MKKPILATLAALTLSTVLFAGETPSLKTPITSSDTGFSAWWNGKYATGNWGGLRDRLEASGVTLFAYYTTDIAWNVSGGKGRGGTYTDDTYFGVNLNLEKLAGWQGGNFTISGINRYGPSVTDKYVGSQYNSQQVYGGQTVFLYQVFLDQHFFNDKISIKLGRFSASDDFNGSPIYGLYMNNAIDGDIRNVLFDTQFSAYPFNTWAARLRFDPTPEFNAQIGIFQTWTDIFQPSNHGLNWCIRSGDGVLLIAQTGWTPEFFKKPVQQASSPDGKTVVPQVMKGLPGHYWVGASLAPWNGFNQFGSAEKAGNSYGFYVHGDQMVYQKTPGSDQGLTVWATTGIYPQANISIMPFQASSGLVYKGIIPSRDQDRTIVGVVYGQFSGDYARTVQESNGGNPHYEMMVEAGHRIQLTKFAYIQPDIQWIIKPAGTGQIPNALVIGAQMGVTF